MLIKKGGRLYKLINDELVELKELKRYNKFIAEKGRLIYEIKKDDLDKQLIVDLDEIEEKLNKLAEIQKTELEQIETKEPIRSKLINKIKKIFKR